MMTTRLARRRRRRISPKVMDESAELAQPEQEERHDAKNHPSEARMIEERLNILLRTTLPRNRRPHIGEAVAMALGKS